MNKKGLTLIELLGATVIIGLVFSLLASILILINRATEAINIESKVNTEGMLVVRTLEEAMKDIDAKDYSLCGPTNCITFESSFDYIFNEVTGEFELITHPTLHTLSIELTDTPELLIDGESYQFLSTELLSTSSLSVSVNGNLVRIVITLNLKASNDKDYQFTANHYFTLQNPPA